MQEALKKLSFVKCFAAFGDMANNHRGKWLGVWSPLCPTCCKNLQFAQQAVKIAGTHLLDYHI